MTENFSKRNQSKQINKQRQKSNPTSPSAVFRTLQRSEKSQSCCLGRGQDTLEGLNEFPISELGGKKSWSPWMVGHDADQMRVQSMLLKHARACY